MPDVSRPGYSDDDRWLREHPGAKQAMYGIPPEKDHRTGVRVGVLGISMQCLTCGTVCIAKHEPIVVTNTETGESWTIPGAWVGPPDDPVGHLFPFGQLPETSVQVNTDEHPATGEAPSPRPTGISAAAAAKGRSKDTPSRSAEARHEVYVRAKRRKAQRV